MDVFIHAQVVEKADVLEGARNPLARDLIGHLPRDGFAFQEDISLGGPINARDHIEQRGFSGAIRADDPKDLAALCFDIDMVGGHDAAEPLAGIPDLQ